MYRHSWEAHVHVFRHATFHALKPLNAAIGRVKKFGILKRMLDRFNAVLWLWRTYVLSAGSEPVRIIPRNFKNGVFSNPCQSHKRLLRECWELNTPLLTGVCFFKKTKCWIKAYSKKFRGHVARFRTWGHGFKCETCLYGRGPDWKFCVCNVCDSRVVKLRDTSLYLASAPSMYDNSQLLIIFLMVIPRVVFST